MVNMKNIKSNYMVNSLRIDNCSEAYKRRA